MTEEEVRHGGLAANPAPVGLPAVSDVAQRTSEVEPKPKRASPVWCTEEIIDSICGQIAEGISLRRICRQEGMPAISAVLRWVTLDEQFKEQYTRAREAQADALADEITDIADDTSNDYTTDEDGNQRIDNEAIARSRLRVDARKWVASKLKPKAYGDKTIHSNDAENPMPTSIVVQFHD